MDQKELSQKFEQEISKYFEELRSGVTPREDSRAFGAMIEQKIIDNWNNICENLGYEPLDRPGRRTIYDFAFYMQNTIVGIDVKTKDLDSNKYSDGGICAVGNLLKFLANDKGIFLIAEFGHSKSDSLTNQRDLEYIRVAPFILLPQDSYRIENLGTGQVRLNYTLNQVWDEIEWERGINEFYNMFVDLSIQHYQRVRRDTNKRIEALERFRQNGFENFTFNI